MWLDSGFYIFPSSPDKVDGYAHELDSRGVKGVMGDSVLLAWTTRRAFYLLPMIGKTGSGCIKCVFCFKIK